MTIPQYLRLDHLVPTPLTREEVRPFVWLSMEQYRPTVITEYSGAVRELEDLVETSLQDHHIVLINGEYIFGYYLGAEWFATQETLMEEYLMRISPGSTSLSEVFDVIRLLVRLHGAREAQLGPRESPALKRLYARHGAQETVTTMRIA
jgi:hypothetical protein